MKKTETERIVHQALAAEGFYQKGDLPGHRLFGFWLRETGLQPIHLPSSPAFEDWARLWTYLCWVKKANPWHIIDALLYGESAYPDRYTQVLEATDWSEGTVEVYLSIGRRVAPELRGRLPFAHFMALAKLPAAEQHQMVEWCETQAEAHGKLPSQRDLQVAVRRRDRERIASGAAELSGSFRVLYVDPPYDTMSLEAIAALPVAAHAMRDAVCFLWCPERLRFAIAPVILAWQFRHVDALVWLRSFEWVHRTSPSEGGQYGHPGTYLQSCHEHVLVCIRGSCVPDRLGILSVQRGPRSEIRHAIEALYDGPYLDVFGETQGDGWTPAHGFLGNTGPGIGAIA